MYVLYRVDENSTYTDIHVVPNKAEKAEATITKNVTAVERKSNQTTQHQ